MEASWVAFLRKYRSMIPVIAAIVLLYAFFALSGIGCPIKFTTGVSCAGCGMTRAWQHILQLDPVAAFDFHPLFWTVPVVVVLFFMKERFPRIFRVTVCIAAVLFVVVYFVRMFDNNCDIVVFEPKNGVFYRVVRNLMQLSGGRRF